MYQIIIGIVISIVIIVLIVMYYKNLQSKKNNLYIERQDSNKILKILDDEIKKPLDGYDYSMGFFIYVNDYTKNFEYWRHILHKGTESFNIEKPKTWQEVQDIFPEQNPGIWISPGNTKMRIAFSTQINKNYCSNNLNKNACNTIDRCIWDNNRCINNNLHADLENNYSIQNTSNSINTIEYIDIEIPYKQLVHIGFILQNKILNVYYNGKLHTIHKFKGDIESNRGLMYFNHHPSYDGSLFNFNYIPDKIKPSDMYNLAQNIPNINLIPKKERINNYLGRFKIGEALKSFFI